MSKQTLRLFALSLLLLGCSEAKVLSTPVKQELNSPLFHRQTAQVNSPVKAVIIPDKISLAASPPNLYCDQCEIEGRSVDEKKNVGNTIVNSIENLVSEESDDRISTLRKDLPSPVQAGLTLIKESAGELVGTQIIINPEEQILYHIVDGVLRKQYKISTGRGSVNNWYTKEWKFLGNGLNTQRTPVGYMTTIGAEKTVCDVDELAAQWTPQSCLGKYPQVTNDLPGDPLWSDNDLFGELTTVVLRLYPKQQSNSNNMVRGILIHGTNKYGSVEEQIPASRGCVRMLPYDILDLVAFLDEDVNQVYVLDREPMHISFDTAMQNIQ
ncbi:MAG: L,D-transpeptidase [Actinomycetota bacterium]